jgi:CelD/BcsL family acetyltransferase involved in cellulose biosynthesis
MPQTKPWSTPAAVSPPAPTPEPAPPEGGPPVLAEAKAPQPAQREGPPLESRDLSIEVVSTAEQLAAVAQECEDLARAALEPNPFYEPWMLRSALREFTAGKHVEVVLVHGPHPSRRKGARQLCGLFPIELRRVGPVRIAQLWQHPYCYLCVPLLRSAQARPTLTRFFDWIAERATLLRLSDLPADGEFHQMLIDELNARGWSSQVASWYTRALLRPSESGEDYLEQALGGKRRKELRRQRARLAEQGRLEIDELDSEIHLRRWLDEFIQLEASGWKGRAAVALSSRERDLRWFAEMTEEALRRGRLMMLGLRLDGRPIALKVNLHAGSGSFAFKIAFDERFSRFSPGVLLELDNVHRVHERKDISWMDSCAASNRFMINHLWPHRRPIQTLLVAPGGGLRALLLAVLPLARLVRDFFRRAKKTNPRIDHA